MEMMLINILEANWWKAMDDALMALRGSGLSVDEPADRFDPPS